ncbi:MAG TPA: hypothetical protein VIM13_03105 [Clostridia bacterium]
MKNVIIILVIALMPGLCVCASAQAEKNIDGADSYIPYENREMVYNIKGKNRPYPDNGKDSYNYSGIDAKEKKGGLDVIPNHSGPIHYRFLD